MHAPVVPQPKGLSISQRTVPKTVNVSGDGNICNWHHEPAFNTRSGVESCGAQCMDPTNCIIVGAESNVVPTSYGGFRYLFNQITTKLPMIELSEVHPEVMKYGERHNKRLKKCQTPSSRGIGILISINTPDLYLCILYQCPGGLLVGKSKLRDKNGSSIVYAGNHSLFTKAYSYAVTELKNSIKGSLTVYNVQNRLFSEIANAYRNSITCDIICFNDLSVQRSERFTQDGYAELPGLHDDDKDRTHNPCIGIVCDDQTVQSMLDLEIEYPGEDVPLTSSSEETLLLKCEKAGLFKSPYSTSCDNSMGQKHSSENCQSSCCCIANTFRSDHIVKLCAMGLICLNQTLPIRRQLCLGREGSFAAYRACDKLAKFGRFLFINIGQAQFNVPNSTGEAREFLMSYSLNDYICCDVKTDRVMSAEG